MCICVIFLVILIVLSNQTYLYYVLLFYFKLKGLGENMYNVYSLHSTQVI